MIDKIYANNGVGPCLIMTATGNHLLHENARDMRERRSLADCDLEYGRNDSSADQVISGKESASLIDFIKRLSSSGKRLMKMGGVGQSDCAKCEAYK